ncbi:MAG: hypothetical protein ACK4YO_03915, partial [Candidatus Altarchaeaceae archaeon]
MFINETTTNIAIVNATTAKGTNVSASDNETVAVIPEWASITINKKANATVIIREGYVTYYYNVTNTGKVTLININVTDDKCPNVVCPNTTLNAGESMICNCSMFINETTTNIAIVNATTAKGTNVSASDNETVAVIPEWASITINKKANATVIIREGYVTYYYNVTNTGKVTLININVTDDKCTNVVCPNTTLNAGESMICNCSMFINETTTNIAIVNATTAKGTNVSASDNETVAVIPEWAS